MGPLWPDGQAIQWRHPELFPAADMSPIDVAYLKFNQAGYIGTFVAATTMEFVRPLFPGDSVARVIELVDVTPEKKTRVGNAHFATFSFTDTNQKGELVCNQTLTMLKYRAAKQ